MTDHTMEEKRNHAVLVGLHASSLSQEENASDATLEELEALLETAGGVCVGSVLQNRETPEARTFIGEGKVAEVAALVQAQGADLVVFDNELSPSQQRVLTEEVGAQVIDRAGLILDIFAQRARTKEGRLQVELAQYQYLLPRLLGMWTHLERQEGAIGTRGPGETQLETDRRHIRRKIQKLQQELEDVRKVRVVKCRGDVSGGVWLGAHDDEPFGPRCPHHELREDKLQVEVLLEDVAPARELAQVHLGDVARDGGLRAAEAPSLERRDELVLGPYGLRAHDVPDRAASVLGVSHGSLPSIIVGEEIACGALDYQQANATQGGERVRRP